MQLCEGQGRAGSVRLPQPCQGEVPAPQQLAGKGCPPSPPFPRVLGEGAARGGGLTQALAGAQG